MEFNDFQDYLSSKRDLRMIWYLTWLNFIDFIFLPPEVIDIWRLSTFISSICRKGPPNEIGTPKNPWFGTSYDIWWSTTSGIIWGPKSPKGVWEWNQNINKSMFWILTWLNFIDFIFWPLKVIDIWRLSTYSILKGQKGAPKWNRNT